jgi:hypothetical protein
VASEIKYNVETMDEILERVCPGCHDYILALLEKGSESLGKTTSLLIFHYLAW